MWQSSWLLNVLLITAKLNRFGAFQHHVRQRWQAWPSNLKGCYNWRNLYKWPFYQRNLLSWIISNNFCTFLMEINFEILFLFVVTHCIMRLLCLVCIMTSAIYYLYYFTHWSSKIVYQYIPETNMKSKEVFIKKFTNLIYEFSDVSLFDEKKDNVKGSLIMMTMIMMKENGD